MALKRCMAASVPLVSVWLVAAGGSTWQVPVLCLVVFACSTRAQLTGCLRKDILYLFICPALPLKELEHSPERKLVFFSSLNANTSF